MTDAGIRKLIDGFGRFRAEHFETEDSLYQRLTREGQSPRIMVIACCDSRVDPAIITDCDPGDLFVVRNSPTWYPRMKPSVTTMEPVPHWNSPSVA